MYQGYRELEQSQDCEDGEDEEIDNVNGEIVSVDKVESDSSSKDSDTETRQETQTMREEMFNDTLHHQGKSRNTAVRQSRAPRFIAGRKRPLNGPRRSVTWRKRD